MSNNIIKFLSYINLQRKIKFIYSSTTDKYFMDIYFREDHSEFQLKLSGEIYSKKFTKRVKINISNLFSLTKIVFKKTIENTCKLKINNIFSEIKDEYTSKILNKCLQNGCREIHSLAFNAMSEIKKIVKTPKYQLIHTYEYQHGLIFWPQFDLNQPAPTHYICASETDALIATQTFKTNRDWARCKVSKSATSNLYVYGEKNLMRVSNIEKWNRKNLTFIQSPIIVNSLDVSIILFEELREIALKYNIKLTLLPHPASKRKLNKLYETYIKHGEDIPKENLVVGYFSSKLVKLQNEGYNTIQLTHKNKIYKTQSIPSISQITSEQIKIYIENGSNR